jgi:transcriptional regulator with XRE-family HTH domain
MRIMSDRQKEKLAISARLGSVARDARKRAALTQEDVAERLGVASEVYGRMERGIIMPSVPTLRKICRTLGVSASELLGLEVAELPVSSGSPQTREEDPPELRRLLRRLRTMDKAQLAAIRTVASVMQTQNPERVSRKPNQRRSKSAKRAPHGK